MQMTPKSQHGARTARRVWRRRSAIATLHAQGRGGGEWTTSGVRRAAHRLGPDRSAHLARDHAEARGFGPFKFLWKMKLEHEPKRHAADPAVLLDRIIGFRGFKSIAFVATVGDGARDRQRLRHRAVEVPHQLRRQPAAGDRLAPPACPAG